LGDRSEHRIEDERCMSVLLTGPIDELSKLVGKGIFLVIEVPIPLCPDDGAEPAE